jgi:plastocyanin
MRIRKILGYTARLAAVGAVVAATSLLVHPAGAGAKGAQEVRLRDDCDAATFNAALGAGACMGNGGTTLDQFNAELAQRQSVGAWKFNPDNTDLRAGQQLVAVNRGGETHTFTQVHQFGGGFVSGNPVPASECATKNADGTLTPAPASATNVRVASGSSVNIPVPAAGSQTLLFQCCIHPWMRVTISPHH